MRRIVIAAAASDFGSLLLRKICESGTEDIEWIYATCHHSDRELEEVKKDRPELSGKLICRRVDMSSIEEVEKMCEDILKKGTPTDIVHLPAPKAKPMQFRKLGWDSFKEHMEISFRSAVLMLKGLLPPMAKAGEGRVIIMSSYYGTEAYTPNFLAPYVCAKAALLALVRSLSREYEGKNIMINAIAPELTDTKYLDEMPDVMKESAALQSERGRMLKPDEVVDVMLKYMDPSLEETGKAVVIK